MPKEISPASSPWTAIVDLARWSPSVHNTQAWKVRPLSDFEAELRYEPRRLLALTDADGRFWTIGMGVFVTCLEVAAAAIGFTLSVEYPESRLDPAAEGSRFFAHLRLEQGARPGEPAASLLKQRSTSRLPFDGRPAPLSVIAELESIAAAGGQSAAFLSDPETVKWVNGLNIETLFYDLRHRPAREEIGLWIRRTNTEARKKGDGFAPKCVGFNGYLLHEFFQRHWLFDKPVIRDAIRFTYARSYRGTRTVGWISSPQETPAQWFRAGKALGRMWLKATEHGLVLHPYGSVITNPSAHARLVERIDSEKPGEETWLLFRIGYSKTPPRSARLPLSEVLE